MSGFWLAHPEWLAPLGFALGTAALLLLLAFLDARRRARLLLGAAGARMPGPRRLAADAGVWLALALVAVALLGPRFGTRRVLAPADAGAGVDVVLLLDVSRSMDARDVAPSRLARARRGAAHVLERLHAGDRAALAGFAGRGVVFAPLTPDLEAIREMLDALDTELVRPGGSHLGRGVEEAVTAFEAGSGRPRALLVLSDGESFGGANQGGRLAARRAGARVVAAALGTEQGATVPDHGVPLRDDRGEVVLSRRRTAALEQLVEGTDGVLLVADAWGRFDVERAVAALRGTAPRDSARAVAGDAPVLRTVAAVRVAPFAAGAFALLALELAGLAGLRRLPGRAAAALLVLAATAAGAALEDDPEAGARESARLEAVARTRPLAPEELVRLGVARAAAGREAAARQALRAAALSARQPEVAAMAYHDLGVLALRRGDLEEARDWFLDALAVEPGRAESQFDLEWTLLALARPPETPRGGAPDEKAEPEESDDQPTPPPARPEAETPPSQPEAAAGRARPTAPPPPELDAAERARWLARVDDDLERALAARAEQPDARSRRRELPDW